MLALSQPKITDMNLGIDASAIKCTRSWFSRLRKVLWSTENQICGDQVSSYFTSYSLLSHETMSHFALGSFNNGVTLLLTSVMTVVRYLAVMSYYRSMGNYAWMVSFHCTKSHLLIFPANYSHRIWRRLMHFCKEVSFHTGNVQFK